MVMNNYIKQMEDHKIISSEKRIIAMYINGIYLQGLSTSDPDNKLISFLLGEGQLWVP